MIRLFSIALVFVSNLLNRIYYRSKKKEQSETRLTDLNVDCIEHIFQYLEFEDLLNAADSNLYLKNVASSIYKQRYSRRKVIVRNDLDCWCLFRSKKKFKVGRNSITIRNTALSLRLLHCFGGLISEIRVKEHVDQQIMAEIKENCSKSLREVTIDATKLNVSSGYSFNMDDFQNIKKIHLFLGENRNSMMHNGHCVQHFPKLKVVHVTICRTCSQNIIKYRRLNPHRESFIFSSFHSTPIVGQVILFALIWNILLAVLFPIKLIFNHDLIFLSIFHTVCTYFIVYVLCSFSCTNHSL